MFESYLRVLGIKYNKPYCIVNINIQLVKNSNPLKKNN